MEDKNHIVFWLTVCGPNLVGPVQIVASGTAQSCVNITIRILVLGVGLGIAYFSVHMKRTFSLV